MLIKNIHHPESGCHPRKKNQNILTQINRKEIYSLIMKNEGIHFRDICKKLKIETGVVQYHTSILIRNKMIRDEKIGRYLCYFNVKTSISKNMIIKSETQQKIVKYLSENSFTSHSTLVRVCKVSTQTITLHCKKLIELGLISVQKYNNRNYYTIIRETAVSR